MGKAITVGSTPPVLPHDSRNNALNAAPAARLPTSATEPMPTTPSNSCTGGDSESTGAESAAATGALPNRAATTAQQVQQSCRQFPPGCLLHTVQHCDVQALVSHQFRDRRIVQCMEPHEHANSKRAPLVEAQCRLCKLCKSTHIGLRHSGNALLDHTKSRDVSRCCCIC